MSGRLANKIAIVTGSNSGIGRGVAVAYAREGATVVCANRSPESKDPLEVDITTHDLIAREGGRAEYMHVQFTDTASVQALVDRVVDKYGRIDILVNNAGMGQPLTSFWDLDDEFVAQILQVNLQGFFKMMRAVAKVMIKQEPFNERGDRGWIVNTGSVFGPRAAQGCLVYSGTKSAIIAMSKTAAVELAPYRVHVNVVNPGTVTTIMVREMAGPVEDFLKTKALLGFGKPEDVAGAYVFLASDEARWMTGSEMFVDSGYVLP